MSIRPGRKSLDHQQEVVVGRNLTSFIEEEDIQPPCTVIKRGQKKQIAPDGCFIDDQEPHRN